MALTITISFIATSNDSQEERTAEDTLLDAVFELPSIYNQRFSANDANSEFMQVNHAAGKHPSSLTLSCLGSFRLAKNKAFYLQVI